MPSRSSLLGFPAEAPSRNAEVRRVGRITAVCGHLKPTVNLVDSLLTSSPWTSDMLLSSSPVADDTGSRRERPVGLGPALRRAWIGYQRRLDRAMADAGFDERRFPDGRVLRLCSEPAGSTISNIGRELGMTRQGASKLVSHLQDRGYVSVADSATSRREKAVTLTVAREPVPRAPNAMRFEPSSVNCVRSWGERDSEKRLSMSSIGSSMFSTTATRFG